jgi:hypothetical protein
MRVLQKMVARVNVITRLGSFAFHIMLIRAHFAPINRVQRLFEVMLR